MSIAGLSSCSQLCAVAVRVMSCCSRCGSSALQFRALQIEYVGDMKAGTLRRRHFGIKEAAKGNREREREGDERVSKAG